MKHVSVWQALQPYLSPIPMTHSPLTARRTLPDSKPSPCQALSQAPSMRVYRAVAPHQTSAVHATWHVLPTRRTLLEVKNVVCADYPQGGVPPGRPAVGVYTAPAEGYKPKALFPHGAAKPKIKVCTGIRRLYARCNCLMRCVVLAWKSGFGDLACAMHLRAPVCFATVPLNKEKLQHCNHPQ